MAGVFNATLLGGPEAAGVLLFSSFSPVLGGMEAFLVAAWEMPLKGATCMGSQASRGDCGCSWTGGMPRASEGVRLEMVVSWGWKALLGQALSQCTETGSSRESILIAWQGLYVPSKRQAQLEAVKALQGRSCFLPLLS